MLVSEIAELIEGDVLNMDEDFEVESMEASDLMSDVLAFFEEGTALITSLCSPQVMRTASIVGIPLVIFVKGKNIPDETVEMARDLGVSVIKTRLGMFEVCGRLFCRGWDLEKAHREDTGGF